MPKKKKFFAFWLVLKFSNILGETKSENEKNATTYSTSTHLGYQHNSEQVTLLSVLQCNLI